MSCQMQALEKLERMAREGPESLAWMTTEQLRTALETLRWWKNLKRTNNESFLPLICAEVLFFIFHSENLRFFKDWIEKLLTYFFCCGILVSF